MHKYLRAIGFSKIKDRKELQKILTDIVVNGKDASCCFWQGFCREDGNSSLWRI